MTESMHGHTTHNTLRGPVDIDPAEGIGVTAPPKNAISIGEQQTQEAFRIICEPSGAQKIMDWVREKRDNTSGTAKVGVSALVAASLIGAGIANDPESSYDVDNSNEMPEAIYFETNDGQNDISSEIADKLAILFADPEAIGVERDRFSDLDNQRVIYIDLGPEGVVKWDEEQGSYAKRTRLDIGFTLSPDGKTLTLVDEEQWLNGKLNGQANDPTVGESKEQIVVEMELSQASQELDIFNNQQLLDAIRSSTVNRAWEIYEYDTYTSETEVRGVDTSELPDLMFAVSSNNPYGALPKSVGEIQINQQQDD